MRNLYISVCIALLVGCDVHDPAATDAESEQFAPLQLEYVSEVSVGAKPIVFQFLGTGQTSMQQVPDPNDLIPDDQAACFTVDLIDVAKDKVVGKAKDCIAIIGEANGGIQVVGTSIFDFGGGHTFTSQGLTSVQATTHGSPEVTHITGAIPTEGENGIVAGTGRFRNFRATVRLSGAVNLSALESDGEITFNCLFVVEPL